ncbi:MAG: sugar phosphate nucleotidyltransferase [Acidobacteriota bacterium]
MTAPRAVVLAAGLGTRMRPLSLRWPKPALPFLNRPLLHWILDGLEEAGVREVLVNLHHRPTMLTRVGASRTGPSSIRWSFEPTILGTAGPLPVLAADLGRDPFLVLNGDTLFLPPIEALWSELQAHPEALCAMALRPREGSYTAVEMDEWGRIVDFGRGTYHFSGAYMARPDLFARLAPGRPAELVTHVLRPLLSSGRIRGVSAAGPWSDLGSPSGYLEAAMRRLGAMSCGEFRVPEGSRMEVRDGSPLLLHPTAWASRRSEVSGPLVLEEGALLGPRCRAGWAVLLPGARPAPSQALEGVLVWPGGMMNAS